MEITNAKYVQYKNHNVSISCTINGKFYSVPIKIGNTEYDEIMRQVDAGIITIADAD